MLVLGRRSLAAFGVAVGLAIASVAAAQPALVAPEPRTKVDAVYPDSERALGHEGNVEVIVKIDPTGHVVGSEIATSGGAAFDDAALAAIRKWEFAPATRDGVAIASRIRVPFHFALPSPKATHVEPPKAPTPAPVTSAIPVGSASAAPPNEPPPPELPPEEVRIVARAAEPSRGASDFRIHVGELGRIPRTNASGLLTLAPSILLTNEGGEGHAEQIFLRGFDAREGQDIELTVGGVPINESGNLHGNGYADTHFIIPELVRDLRVVEGPFDPKQGNYAVAGSAEYELGLERRGLTSKFTTGSFNSQRGLIMWGPRGESTGTFGGAEIATTDGYGQNRDAKRASAMVQYEGHVGDHGSYRLTGQAYSTTYHSAGVLRDDDYRAGRVGFYDTYDPRQGGDSSRYSISADVESKGEDNTVYKGQVFVIERAMRLRENFTGYLLDTQEALQAPHGQRGDLIDLAVAESTIGARGSARLEGKLFGHTQSLELGTFARGDKVDGTQYRIAAANNAPYHQDTNLSSNLGDIGLYADASIKPLDVLTIRGGVRAELLDYDVLNNCAVTSVAHPSKENPPGDQSCLSQQEFGAYREPISRASATGAAFLPRATVLLGPFTGFTYSASVGKGIRSIDPSYITENTQTPFASVRAYEAGASYAGTIGSYSLVAKSIFFQTHVDKDLLFNETVGRTTLANGTTRTGWTGTGRFTGPHFDQSANVTLVKSTFDDTHLLVPYVPDVVARSDSAVHGPLPFMFRGRPFEYAIASGITYVGRRALPYGERSDTIFTIDGSASLAWRGYEMAFLATNLLDNKYRLGEYDYASDFHTQVGRTLVPVRHFTAGPPQMLFLSFQMTLGGDV